MVESQASVAARDRQAWEAICGWPAAAGYDPVRQGLDFGHLTRWMLWDKVGRAVRGVEVGGQRSEVRGEGTEVGGKFQTPVPTSGSRDASTQLEATEVTEGGGVSRHLSLVTGCLLPTTSNQQLSTLSPAGRLASRVRLAGERRLRRRLVLYCPFTGSRHARLLEPLIAVADTYVVVTPAPAPAGAVAWDGRSSVVGCRLSVEAWPTAEQLATGIDTGLRRQGVALLEADRAHLMGQLEDQIRHVARVEADLKRLRPDALLLPTDNHSPFIEYALIARKLGIPCAMLQHGLDCERYYLDEAYASHIAVWGPDRQERYRRDSVTQPAVVRVTGNPYYDAPPPQGKIGADRQTWLWATRPHRPEKCYPPSRRPDEGLRILEALLEALDAAPDCRLLIQPHPFDDADLYRERLAVAGATRVMVASDALTNLLMCCGVVITEDSTAGMDAMRAGAILVHAHLADSKPVMPFVDYGAALPGFSGEELRRSLARAVAEPEIVLASQRQGRERFLDDFAGPRDGRSTERFVQFVKKTLGWVGI